MIMTIEGQRTVSTKEAAELLDISRPAFYTFAEEHHIEPVNPPNKNQKRAGKLLWNYDDIKPYIISEPKGQE